jgi:cytochrome b subunit of formate dehydrogenase
MKQEDSETIAHRIRTIKGCLFIFTFSCNNLVFLFLSHLYISLLWQSEVIMANCRPKGKKISRINSCHFISGWKFLCQRPGKNSQPLNQRFKDIEHSD